MVQRSNKAIKVLLVEDNAILQHVHSMLLTRLNCKIDLAATGQQALDKAHHRYDIIFTDINLPDMRGDQVIAIIRAQGEHMRCVPIVVLSSESDVLIKENCYAQGVKFYLAKPVSNGMFKQIFRYYRLSSFWN